SGSTFLKLVGSKGSMDIAWDSLTLKRNAGGGSDDPFLAEKAKENSGRPDRKKLVPPLETVYRAEDGYKGAHYDHFANFFMAIRENGSVAQDPAFGFRAAAPALLCNESYKKNEFINWDPEKMKLV
ncbi:gfo/Idh/MocA family oxidoreductase, partial [Salegentibacter sp. BLCTC]|nr:gfo/Idh/MocA family oxidoreductase [Salegentibacter sp. BLCTC]